MAQRSCSIIPMIRDKEGKLRESTLFRDLLRYTGSDRELSRSLYGRIKNPDFIRELYPSLTMDDLGEPTIQSLYENTGLRKMLDDRKLVRAMNIALGAFGSNGKLKTYKETQEMYMELRERCALFNKTNPFRKDYVADVTRTTLPESNKTAFVLSVQPRNRLNSLRAEKMEYDNILNNRLREILASYGISTGLLTELEERRGIAGVTDFDRGRDAATGMIELIRLAKGEKGEAALPEEFSHFALGAMGDHPLVSRLVNALSDEAVLREVFGEDYDLYMREYAGDMGRMSREAAGKLVARHLLDNGSEYSGKGKSLLERLIRAIKDFFGRITASDFKKAMIEADGSASAIAGGILTGRMNDVMKVENITDSGEYLSAKEQVDNNISTLQRIIDRQLKQLAIYKKRNPRDKITREQLLLIDKLERLRDQKKDEEGINLMLSHALGELRASDQALSTLNGDTTMDAAEKASALRDLRNSLYAYSEIVNLVQADLAEDSLSGEDGKFSDETRRAVDSTVGIISRVMAKYKKIAFPQFVEFMRPIVGDSITIPLGKFKGKTYKLEDMVKMADTDITIFDRWLDSMADSSDIILTSMDRRVKMQREKARKRTIELQKRLTKEGLILEEAGEKGFEFMFKKDKDGRNTGRYVMKIDKVRYNKAKKEMLERLAKKYGNSRFGISRDSYEREKNDWFKENTEEIEGLMVPRESIYGDPQYKAMNKAQRRFYDAFMEIKAEIDALLPENQTTLDNAVQIRKDLVERVQKASGVKGGVQEVIQSIKDEFVSRVDDDGFARTVIDAEGNEVQSLPIYFTRRLEDPSLISTDAVSTLSAYASMALDYHYMGEIIDQLELGRDILAEREIGQTRGGNMLQERFEAAGRKVSDKLSKSGRGNTNFMNRLNDYFEMQVYGRYMKDEGTITTPLTGSLEISLAKLANNLNRMSSTTQLGLNLLAGISNVATGIVMMNVEAFTGEFFGVKDTAVADKNYSRHVMQHMGNIGARVKTDKLSLWDEYFDIMQDYDGEIRNVDFDKRNAFQKLMGSNALFFITRCGEHWMQNRTALALANTIRLKDRKGNRIPLFDAYEIVKEEKGGKVVKAELRLKEGLTKEDGSPWTAEDEFNYKQKVAAINQGMHGIYNKADRSAIKRLAVGRLAMLYRNWMRPNYMKRFKAARYNMDLQAWTEGYYNTSWRFFMTLMGDIRHMQFNLLARYNELSDTEKHNIRRAVIEAGHFIALATFLGLMGWDDDKERPWHMQMAEYQARRLYTELGVQVPGPTMLTEGLKILKQPAASISTMQNIINLGKVVLPGAWDEEIESGRYKGYYPVQKYILELVPARRSIYNALSPEESIAFYKNLW